MASWRATGEYRPFPEEDARDDSHQAIDVPLMASLLRLPVGKRVLEIGCGGGGGLVSLARVCRPSRLTGLDIDDRLLARARRAVDGAGVPADLILGDARALPFPDRFFDLVFDFGTCWHIARPGAALAEVARVLTPDGLFVHETKLNQLTSHPVRSFARSMPWAAVPHLRRHRASLLWEARRSA